MRWRVLLVLISSVLLAWSLQRALAGLDFRSSPEFTYTLTVPAKTPRNPAAKADQLWIRYVVVDGRLRPHRQLERTGPWREVAWSLAHEDDRQPATVHIRGRRVTVGFITSAWSGVVRVEGANGLAWEFDLFRDEQSRTTLRVIDLAAGRVVSEGTGDEAQNPIRTSLMLLPLLLVALLWRPWRSSSTCEAWALLHVGLLHVLAWLTQAVAFNNDGPAYVSGISMFAAGQPSYFPPGYPLFLGFWIALVPSVAGIAVTGAQHVLMVLTLLGLQRVARAFLPTDIACAGFLLAGSAAPTLFLPQAIFSENLALFGSASALWFASRPGTVGALRRDVTGGLLVGCAALARVVPLAVLALPVLLLHIATLGVRRQAFVRTGRLLLGAVTVVIVAAGWIWHNSGVFSLSNAQDLHIYNRVVFEQLLLDREGQATRRFLALLGDRPLQRVPHWDMSRYLREQGLAGNDAKRLMGDVAREGWTKYPWRFARYSLGLARREYEAAKLVGVPYWSDDVDMPMLDSEPLLGVRSASIFWRQDLDALFGVLWPILMWAPLLGLVFLPVMEAPLVFLALLTVPAGYLLASSLVEAFDARYVVGVLPFALILVPAPIAAALRLWNRRHRR